MVWYLINSQLRSEYINQIQTTLLELQDSIPLGELKSDQPEIFNVLPKGERPYEFYDNVHVAIVYEISLDRRRIQRSVYSLLDWIGDIGGLLEAMFVIFSLLIAIYHYKAFEIHMIGQLFSLTQNLSKQEIVSQTSAQKISQTRLFLYNSFLFLCKKIPKG